MNMLHTQRKKDISRISALMHGYRSQNVVMDTPKIKQEFFASNSYIFFIFSIILYFIHPLLAITPIAYLFIHGIKKRARHEAICRDLDKDYSAFLISLASSIKAGSDPLAAVVASRSLFRSDSTIVKIIADFEQNLNEGMSEQEAIQKFGRSISHPDLQLFRLAFMLARKEGSSLCECLHRLARVTRMRQSFRRKINAAIAMQKFSAFGISGCSLLIVSMQYFNSPDSFHSALNHSTGSVLLAAGFVIILIGIVWMLRLAGRSEL